MPVVAKDMMSTTFAMAYEGWSIDRLLQFFSRQNVSGAPVIASDHSLVGVVSLSDVARFFGQSDRYHSELLSQVYSESVGSYYDQDLLDDLKSKAKVFCTVNQIMTRTVITVEAHSSPQDVAQKMLEHDIRRIFVTESGIIRGMITSKDLLVILAELPSFE